MGPTPSTVNKKPEKSKKLIGSTPLRRSERGKNLVDVHAANVKSTEKSADISRESAEEGSLHTSEKHVGNAKILSKPVGEASAKQDANTVNDVAWADTMIFSESVVDIPANHDADASVLSQPIRDILAIEEIALEHQDEVENVVSGDDAVVSSEPIGDISTKQHADIDMALNDCSADVSDDSGSNDVSLEYADGSHAAEDPNGTGPNHVAPHVEFVELGIPAGNCNREKAHDTT
nr:hypothetical protein [Tanacetum cinerariifolium]